ncbi:IMPACT family protein [Salinicola avicenniae]|uniref:IMPACT family protein n=1 Tax=Salinicola avicenniae TaxID=2916836 RepID=UPI0020731631|nr:MULTISPECIES: YigZ family protein [unclassified Salinicola]
MRYSIPALAPDAIHANTLEIEKSRFLCWLAHTPDTAAFDRLLACARTRHPDASHHCSAFIAGAPQEQVAIGFSDDGEPGGTAGRPMFQALAGSGLGQVGAVVTRYFGGTKLGTGGLVRAYTQAVLKALETLPLRDHTERRVCRVQVDFSQEAEARHWLDTHEVPVDGADYDSQGVTLTLGWPMDDSLSLETLSQRLRGGLIRR